MRTFLLRALLFGIAGMGMAIAQCGGGAVGIVPDILGGGVTASCVPPRIWQKYVVANSGVNFLITRPDGTTATVAKAAGTSQSVTLLTPAVNFKVTDCVIKSGTAFSGTTTLTATVGITGTLTGCISSAYDLKATVSNTNFAIPTLVTNAASVNGTDAVILALTSTVDNISAISVGSVTVWVRIEYLP